MLHGQHIDQIVHCARQLNPLLTQFNISPVYAVTQEKINSAGLVGDLSSEAERWVESLSVGTIDSTDHWGGDG